MSNSKKHQLWRHYERHPLSAEYEDLTGPARQRLRDSIKTHGFDIGKPIILAEHEGKLKVLDGWQRQSICCELDVRPAYDGIPSNMTDRQFVEQANDARRHETEQQQERRISKRRTEVAAAKVAGQSNRAIAEQHGIDAKMVRKDLEAASKEGIPTVPPDGEVVGKDRKKRKARKPRKKKTYATGDRSPVEPKTTDENGDLWSKAPGSAVALAAEPLLKDIASKISHLQGELSKDGLTLYSFSMQSVIATLKNAADTIRGGLPAYICPYCGGTLKVLVGAQKDKRCGVCCSSGWVTKSVYKQSPKGQA